MVEMTMEAVGFRLKENDPLLAINCVRGETHLLMGLFQWSKTPHPLNHWPNIYRNYKEMTLEDKIYLIVGSCLPEGPKPYEVIIHPEALNRIKEIIK